MSDYHYIVYVSSSEPIALEELAQAMNSSFECVLGASAKENPEFDEEDETETEIVVVDSDPTLQTDPRYWDCECDTNYIHPKSETLCERCGVSRLIDDPPDSMMHEVEAIRKVFPHL